MDISTSLGILSVVLTIIIFVITYRQTIGAGKERSISANKLATDTLFRRLTLEPDFLIDLLDIEKMLNGIALESKIRTSTLYTPVELEAVLLARVLDNDYIPEENRSKLIARLKSWFLEKEPDKNEFGWENRLEKIETGSSIFSDKAASVGLLGIFSGIISVTIAAGILTTFLEPPMNISSLKELFTTDILPAVFAVFLTVTGLVFSVFLKDSWRATASEEVQHSDYRQMEWDFMRQARRLNNSVRIASGPFVDLIFDTPDGVIEIEFKTNINKIGASRAAQLIERLSLNKSSDSVICTYIVSDVAPNSKLRSLSTETVKIVSRPEIMKILRDSKPILVTD